MTAQTLERADTGAPKPLRWPFWLAGALFGLSVLVAVAATVEMPYYSFSPGPVFEIDDFVVLDDPDPLDGEFYMLTVSLTEVTPIEFVMAQFDPAIDLIARERVRPVGVSDEQYRENNRRSMDESKATAIFAALDHLGYEVIIRGEGVLVAGLTEGSPVDGILEVDDVITHVDGQATMISSDLTGIIGERKIGDSVELTVIRGEETLTFEVTLVEHVNDPERPMIGFLATTYNWNYEPPFEVDIDSTNVGGPSAGLMYTLTLIDMLTEADLAKGHVIAGTGTMQTDGTVGSIGGIRQKVAAAAAAGAEYILVPADNWDSAQTIEADIELVRVENLADALAFLESLPEA